MNRVYTEFRISHKTLGEKEEYEATLDESIKKMGYKSRNEWLNQKYKELNLGEDIVKDRNRKAIGFNELLNGSLDEYSSKNTDKNLTGILDLDRNYINYIAKGSIVSVVSRPYNGKDVLIKQIARHCAETGRSVLYISMFQESKEIIDSYLSQLARVEYKNILSKDLSEEELSRLKKVSLSEQNKLKNFYIYEGYGLTVEEIEDSITKYKEELNIDIVCLDSLEFIGAPVGLFTSKEEKQEHIFNTLRILIRKLNIIGFFASEVSVKCELRMDRHPTLSDLNFGTMGQDSALVLSTYRDELYNPYTEVPNTMGIDIIKNRFGPTGRVRVMYEGEYQSIS